jgi:hypothetical protein
MPLKPHNIEQKGPDGSHFAALLDSSGLWSPIVPGTSLWIIEDKNHADKIYPMVLKKVNHSRIVLEMKHPDGSVTEYVYQLTTAKPKSKSALERLIRNRGGMPVKTGK